MNPYIETIPPSLIRSINARKQPGDIDLGLGEPTLLPDCAPFEAALEWTRANGSPYSPNAGLPELRTLVAEYAESFSRREWRPENVCVTVGSEEALYLAIKAVVDPAEHEVLIVEPCYLAYPKICLLEGIEHRMVALDPADGFAPSADAVLSAVTDRTRLIVVNSPSNPTGRVWAEDELRKLAAGLASFDRQIFVLTDEVYRELFFTSEPPRSIAEFHPDTLIAGSLSKSNSLTGLRLGWLIGPERPLTAAIKVHQFINTAASTFSQQVAISLFRDGDPGVNRAYYLRQRDRAVDAAREAGLEIVRPEGAFYCLIRAAVAGKSAVEIAEGILDDRRVVTVPGSAFGESAEGWLRLSLVAGEDDIAEGIRRIGGWLAENG